LDSLVHGVTQTQETTTWTAAALASKQASKGIASDDIFLALNVLHTAQEEPCQQQSNIFLKPPHDTLSTVLCQWSMVILLVSRGMRTSAKKRLKAIPKKSTQMPHGARRASL